jgi:hypothetical protein
MLYHLILLVVLVFGQESAALAAIGIYLDALSADFSVSWTWLKRT